MPSFKCSECTIPADKLGNFGGSFYTLNNTKRPRFICVNCASLDPLLKCKKCGIITKKDNPKQPTKHKYRQFKLYI